MVIAAMTLRIDVFDTEALRCQLQQRKIRFIAHHSPYCWAYCLLRTGAPSLRRVEAYGFRLKPEYEQHTLVEIRVEIDGELPSRAEALLWNLEDTRPALEQSAQSLRGGFDAEG